MWLTKLFIIILAYNINIPEKHIYWKKQKFVIFSTSFSTCGETCGVACKTELVNCTYFMKFFQWLHVDKISILVPKMC